MRGETQFFAEGPDLPTYFYGVIETTVQGSCDGLTMLRSQYEITLPTPFGNRLEFREAFFRALPLARLKKRHTDDDQCRAMIYFGENYGCQVHERWL